MNCEAILIDDQPVVYDKKSCAYCGCEKSIKKLTIIFKYSYSAKMCCFCIEKLGGIENARDWLEENAKFNNRGKFFFLKK
jgi:hypothetical protein